MNKNLFVSRREFNTNNVMFFFFNTKHILCYLEKKYFLKKKSNLVYPGYKSKPLHTLKMIQFHFILDK